MANSIYSMYQGKNILITGGLGFIGSNLALRLVEARAQVTLIDAMIRKGDRKGDRLIMT